jgi:hypothetical protein
MNAEKSSPKRIVFSGDERGEMGKQAPLSSALDESDKHPVSPICKTKTEQNRSKRRQQKTQQNLDF